MAGPLSNELHPQQIVMPNVTTAVRDTYVCELGTQIFNTTTGKINFCITAFTAGAGSWEAVTSA